MIVDSSALAEQVVGDVIASAFDSAGQRCSALRVLCLQEDVADRTLAMLKGALHELTIGRTDTAWPPMSARSSPRKPRAIIEAHRDAMRALGCAGRAVAATACDRNTEPSLPPTIIELKKLSGPRSARCSARSCTSSATAVEDLDRLIDEINAYGLRPDLRPAHAPRRDDRACDVAACRPATSM